MALSDKKYTEPSEVLLAFVDDYGAPLLLGDQKDIGEFNLNFLDRIEEGLGERIETKKLANDFKQEHQNVMDVIPDIKKSSILDDVDSLATSSDEISYLSESPANSIFNIFFGMITIVLKVENKQK